MKRMTLAVLCCLAIGRYAGAMDKPPDTPRGQRSWLHDGLVADMNEINRSLPGTFSAQEHSRAEAITNPHAGRRFKISDDDTELLAEYYHLTRARAEADLQLPWWQQAAEAQARGQAQGAGQVSDQPSNPRGGAGQAGSGKAREEQFAEQPPNPPLAGQRDVASNATQPQAGRQDAALKAAQADRDAIIALGEKLSQRGDAAKSLTGLIYTSLPGFFLRRGQRPPISYFDIDSDQRRWTYLGPAYNNAYAGARDAPHTSPRGDRFNRYSAPAPQLPTWFPRQPDCIEWNRLQAARQTMQLPIRMNTPATMPGNGNTGSYGPRH